MKERDLISIVKKRALKSICSYKIAAIGFNKRFELLCSYTNKPRFYRKGGGLHAEMELMRKHPKSVKTIIICRVGLSGNILPIHACPVCQRKADELGIKIITVKA
jgi:hypothetical protein